jgi:predicted AlkP superfamily phosphohydrolase/phosphomutase
MSGTLTAAWEQRVREKVREYYRQLDGLIGELRDSFEDATIIVASDHGFGPQVRTFYVNSWLEQLGLLAWQDGQAPASNGTSALGLNQLARHVYQIDWSRTRAFAPMPSGNGIHIVKADDAHPNGVRPEEYGAFRDWLAQQVLQVKDAETGEPIVARAGTRDELFRGPSLAVAPDLTLELSDGGLMSILSSPEIVRRRPLPTGTHRPEGIFVAAGPEIERGQRLPAMSILDVAPLMLYQLGLAVPDTLEGRLVTEAIDPAALSTRPPQREAAVSPAAAAEIQDLPLDAEAEAEILDRLRALGYVE